VRFTIAYTVLFLYVIAAIVFWGYSLQKKSGEIFRLENEVIELKKNDISQATYKQKIFEITDKKRRRTMQYWGEGGTFLIVILISAFFVYRAFHKQIQLTKLQRNFMMSVTHELKTPLAGVILNLQTLLRRKVDPEMQTKLLKSSEREAKRLSNLCNNILVSTQLEDAGKKLYQSECDLNEMVMQSAEDFMETIEQRELKVDANLEQAFSVKGDSSLWQLVVSNLLQNAHKYSPLDQPIEVKIFSDKEIY
jgi:signal transduction histidine kinase